MLNGESFQPWLLKNWTEQERAPHERHAGVARQLLDAAGRKVGARELEPELERRRHDAGLHLG
jgi:hypothetical protein